MITKAELEINKAKAGSTYFLLGGGGIGEASRASGHLCTLGHTDLAEDLSVHVFSLAVFLGIRTHFESVIHHFLLHAHFLGFFGEVPHHLVHLLGVHGGVDLGHDVVDTLEALHHRRVHLRSSQLVHDHRHLGRHCVVHLDLGAGPHQVLGHQLGRPVLVLHGQVLDLLQRLGLLVLEFGALSFDLADSLLNGALVLLGLLLRVDFRCTVSHL